jgi:hypothetical protein
MLSELVVGCLAGTAMKYQNRHNFRKNVGECQSAGAEVQMGNKRRGNSQAYFLLFREEHSLKKSSLARRISSYICK